MRVGDLNTTQLRSNIGVDLKKHPRKSYIYISHVLSCFTVFRFTCVSLHTSNIFKFWEDPSEDPSFRLQLPAVRPVTETLTHRAQEDKPGHLEEKLPEALVPRVTSSKHYLIRIPARIPTLPMTDPWCWYIC